jgi:cytochrome c peroxidase
VWRFEGVGPRRTQTTAGNIVATAPFHWSGDVPDMDVIIDTNMERMGRFAFEDRAPTTAFERLLATFAPPASPRAASDEDALAGRAIFESAGCAECHSGDVGTNNRTVDVGTGEPFQVPHLVGVAHRAPFFHDGCAGTLRDVLDGCETHVAGAHAAGALTDAQKELLVAYLESR